ANRGIGRELANHFQARDYDVNGTYRPQTRDDTSVVELKKQRVHTFEVDLTDEQSTNAAAVAYGERPLDVLVNRFYEMTAEDFVSHFNINKLGPFLVSKAFLPALSLSPLGKIINLPGKLVGVARKYGGNTPYRVSKINLNQLTKTMAVGLHEAGSKVATRGVHPGWLPTKMTGFQSGDDMDTRMKGLVETIEKLGTEEAGGF
ncbi:hypothetical protein B0T14DRAFT_412511, partial [Immersiella caudata]